MNSIKNRVQLIGHLGAKPEVKVLPSGKKVAKFTMATNETYKNQKGEKVTDTCWHNMVAWGSAATVLEKYLDKGHEIAVEGRITSRNYTDKEGQKRYITEIVVNEILMLHKKK